MSRIDRALRIREGGTASPDQESNRARIAPLEQYDRERTSAVPESPLESRPAEAEDAVVDLGARAPVAKKKVATIPVRRVEVLREAQHDTVGHRGGRSQRFGVDADREARLVTGTSSEVSVEQYRRMAAVLHEEQVRSQLKTVIVTSSVPGEGKTLTVVNLALTLSESYRRRVLVIDADFRGPSLHAALNVPNVRGLADALHDGDLTFAQISNELAVLTAGNPGPTPLAALTSDRMARVVEECASQFDWVLIDTPPIGVLPDAQVLLRLAGAVLFVIGAGTTPAATVERAVAELGGPDAIFGVVLNRVPEHRIPAAGYYRYYKHSG